MPDVTYCHGDSTTTLEVAADESLMEVAVRNGVPGIVGECGGALSCSTCHVYVDDDQAERLGPPDDLEDEMLDGVACERLSTSRLSCQLRPLDDGSLRVTTPPSQY